MRNYHETNGDTFLTASAAASSVHLLNLMMDIVIVGSGTSCVGGKVLVNSSRTKFSLLQSSFFNPFFLFLITSGLRVVLFCGDGGGGVVFFTSHWLSPLTIDLEN